MSFQKYGEQLAAKGYDIIALSGKVPIQKAWQSRPAPDFAAHPDANIGVVLGGKHNIIAIDIDVLDAAASAQIKALTEEILGAAPERIGKAPKTLLVYRCSVPTKKIKTAIYDLAGHDCCVEILADGQQFVASGTHPDTNTRYKWPQDSLLDYPADELTEVTTQQIADVIAAANIILSQKGEIKAKSLTNGSSPKGFQFNPSEQATTVDKLTAALDHLENTDLHYDDWVHICHAVKGAVGDAGFSLFQEFSRRSAKNEDGETERLWSSISEVTRIGAGTIFHLAAQTGFDPANWDKNDRFSPNSLMSMDVDEFSDYAPQDAPETFDEDAVDDRAFFSAKSVIGPLPARQWAIDQWIPAQTVSLLFGAGGVGKSLLAQQFANRIAEGEPVFGLETTQMPVLYVGCEDDALELSRRQLDINEWRGVDEFGSGPDNCWLWPRIGEDNVIVTFPSQGEALAGEFFETLYRTASEVKGDADAIFIILDTAADMFGGNENVRREVNTFVKTFLGSLVLKLNATVLVLAHPSLSGLASGSGLSGSTAWENSVRSRAYLSRDAETDGVRILSRKKSNYSETGDESKDIKLIWDKGVLTVPTSTSQLDKINDTALKHAVMAEVDIAWGEKNPIRKLGPRGYRKALPRLLPQHKSNAVVKVFQELLGDGNIVHVERLGHKTEKAIR